jgi:hypothetical protein
MAKLNGVLLRGADGALYLVEGGLRASRIDPADPAYQAMVAHVERRFIPAQALADVEAQQPVAADDQANQRSRILQALNVEIERSDEGDILTIESTGTFSGT